MQEDKRQFEASLSKVSSEVVLQQPKAQHVLVGSNATFSCRVRDSYVIWKAIFFNGTIWEDHHVMRGDTHYYHQPQQGRERTYILIINTFNAQSWNNTLLQCVAYHASRPVETDYVALVIYTSLRPLSPMNVSITPINTTTLILSWIPDFLWQGYQIDSFSVNITNINNSERVLETTIEFEDMTELTSNIIKYIFTNLNVSHPCTEFLFSVSSVSVMYGESDPTVISGGFDQAPNEIIVTNNVVYFQANGTPLFELEIQLPTNVCSYQNINYIIVIKEQRPTEFNHSFIFGPFLYHGSGRVTHQIVSGLTRNKNYSLSVIVDTTLANSITTTYFDTTPWLEFSEDNIIISIIKNITTNQEVASNKNMSLILYIIVLGTLLAVVVLVFIGFIAIFVYFCIITKRKRKRDNTNRRVMVHNPIYDRGPLYDTIPRVSEKKIEISAGTTAFSGFQSSSSTSRAADDYADEFCNSPLQRKNTYPSGNVHATIQNFNLKKGDFADSSTKIQSLENGFSGQTIVDAERGEEVYTLMLPSGES